MSFFIPSVTGFWDVSVAGHVMIRLFYSTLSVVATLFPTRGSHFYLTLYWAQALATQTKDSELNAEFKTIAAALLDNEETIVKELIEVQGNSVSTGGYYLPNSDKTDQAMRPSATLNKIIG